MASIESSVRNVFAVAIRLPFYRKNFTEEFTCDMEMHAVISLQEIFIRKMITKGVNHSTIFNTR